MANILFRTRGNANPKGKPRVYFTCHPADFEKYFDKVCEDIFKTHDCAIYYTEDMTASIAAEDLATDLGSNNLFVIPVTFKLLTQPNRAMDEDFPYAQQEHLPVLPFMMEPGMDMIYSRPDKFGKLQYLNPCSTDTTEISYEKKLGKFLESVLISDEMAQRVRAAFDAYIFLSYRKKDRRYANELMRMIHRNPECRDIAIWYDEFLTPGESFQDSIEKILHSSKLFTLLVTPNLLEEPDGKPNFVMAQEYPAAREAGIHILPAEMEATDKTALAEKFAGIPDCLDVHDEITFHQQFLDALRKVAVTSNDTDPEHTFLIGLAYLEGIDVETDRERGLELITSAAEADLPEAMGKLHHMYDTGTSIQLNYSKAAYWAEQLVAHFRKELGEEHPSTLTWLNNLAFTYGKLGEYQKALELHEKVYAIECQTLGEEHPDTLTSLGNLAVTFGDQGNHKKALELNEKVYAIQCGVLGETHPETLASLNNLASNFGDRGDYSKALELHEKAYGLQCKILGETHPDALISLNNLAANYSHMGNHEKALELNEKVYALRRSTLGETHPDTLLCLNNLASCCGELGDHQKALELKEYSYNLLCQILGEEHPHTLTVLLNLAYTYSKLGEHEKALAQEERIYSIRCKTLEETHMDIIRSLYRLANTYAELGEHEKSAERKKKALALLEKRLG